MTMREDHPLDTGDEFVSGNASGVQEAHDATNRRQFLKNIGIGLAGTAIGLVGGKIFFGYKEEPNTSQDNVTFGDHDTILRLEGKSGADVTGFCEEGTCFVQHPVTGETIIFQEGDIIRLGNTPEIKND